MRADEYLVEEVKRLRKENDGLTNKLNEKDQELSKLQKEKDELFAKEEPENIINVNEKKGELFTLTIIESYNLKKELKSQHITIEDLNKALIDDDFCLEYKNLSFSGYSFSSNLIRITTKNYNHVVKNKYGNVYLNITLTDYYEDRPNVPKVSIYTIDNSNLFLDYDSAKEYGLKQLRKNIKEALNEYNKELEDAKD